MKNPHTALQWNRRTLLDFLFILIGAALQAFAMRLFLIPALLASGGVSGLSQILNYFYGWPVGMMILIGNIPLFIIGWRFLGGPRFALRTIFAVVVFASLTDVFANFLPPEGITNDLLLNALYGGVVSGLASGLIYRGRGTSGGTDILVRIIIRYKNMPISQTYLITDSLIMLLAGLSFSWEHALYAVVMLYISGLAAETFSQGAHVVRTALIITNQPELVANGILHQMQRGLTRLDGQGAYTGEARVVLYCVISRAELGQLKTIVSEADPKAFVVIGQAYEALGEGFVPIDD